MSNKKIIIAIAATVALCGLGFYLYNKKLVKDKETNETEKRLNESETLRRQIEIEASRRGVSYQQQLKETAKRMNK